MAATAAARLQSRRRGGALALGVEQHAVLLVQDRAVPAPWLPVRRRSRGHSRGRTAAPADRRGVGPEAERLAISLTDAPHLSEAGTKTMDVDCGGGTADIMTLEVLSVASLRLNEVPQPQGGPSTTHVASGRGQVRAGPPNVGVLPPSHAVRARQDELFREPHRAGSDEHGGHVASPRL